MSAKEGLSGYFAAADRPREGLIARFSDLFLVAGIVAIVALMVLPITPWLIDLLGKLGREGDGYDAVAVDLAAELGEQAERGEGQGIADAEQDGQDEQDAQSGAGAAQSAGECVHGSSFAEAGSGLWAVGGAARLAAR